MKNKIQETMEGGEREFDQKQRLFLAGAYHSTQFNKWLKAHQTAILEAVREEVRGKLSDDGKYGWKADNLHTDANKPWMVNRNAGAREALQDIETIINKAIGV